MTDQKSSPFSKKSSKTSNYWLLIARVLAILIVIAMTIFIYSIREQAEELAIYGYPGIFLLAFLTNATVFLPAPGIAVVFAMGAIFNPCLIALSAGVGGALGELSGYLAGFSGQAVIEHTTIYDRFQNWIQNNGFVAILILAALPNPFFDIAGVAAGILKMPILRFLLAVWVGVTIKMFIFAWVGSTSLSWLLNG
jgi:uncharacterized membrane protein YdjX (TVP38/TMEM64 family)